MYCSCDICDKFLYEEFRNNHLQPGYRKRLANSIIRKYFIIKPDKFVEIIANYSRSHNGKYENFFAIILVKLLTPSDQNKNIGSHFTCHPSQQCISEAYFFFVRSNNIIKHIKCWK